MAMQAKNAAQLNEMEAEGGSSGVGMSRGASSLSSLSSSTPIQSMVTISDSPLPGASSQRHTRQAVAMQVVYPAPSVPGSITEQQVIEIVLGLAMRILATLAAHPAVCLYLRRPLGHLTTAFHFAAWLLAWPEPPETIRQGALALILHSANSARIGFTMQPVQIGTARVNAKLLPGGGHWHWCRHAVELSSTISEVAIVVSADIASVSASW
ncbi:hypothetical protein AMAG_19577 [Allomyces macrogynus ATCC 38327]|uniref:Uncharacterized protein n=1 Tax=Allomyces macrogynus (strain ATCC 38327) TaxID=578462 RepID=A0A0L0SVK4_ALLM3|nr:hypothetical protein AMAG_19577 [Allomyces macrogynus ATCC 38327]|eukprot:KNE66420.1 hypothetical protein AMAG_19577 [Allomyces macrogynus ATCC 38327]